MRKENNSIFYALKSFFKLVISGFSFGVRSDISDAEKNIMDKNNETKNEGNFNSSSDDKDDLLKEEAITSPGKQAIKNFFHNPLGIIGLIIFLTIAIVVFVGSHIIQFDRVYQQPVLKNISPGRNYLNYPKELEKVGVKELSVGGTFSVALDKNNKIHFWGKNNENNVTKMPENIKNELKNEEIEHVAAGDKHIIVSTKSNKLFGWGNKSFNQTELPYDAKTQVKEEGIEKLGAADQYSIILTKKHNLIIWGSTLNTRLNQIPSDIKGKVVDFSASATNVLTILNDGSIEMLGVIGGENTTKMPDEIKNKKVKIKQVALSQKAVIALLEDGTVKTWGPVTSGITGSNIPKFDSKITKVQATRTSVSALSENGTIYAWGIGKFGETKAPKGKFKDFYSSYFDSYAIDENGKIKAWGLKGFLFGSDDNGRDLFQRLVYGGQTTIIIAAVAVFIEILIGIIVGMISGYAGGKIDNILMRITEIVSSFPFYPLVITLSALLPVNVSQNTRLFMIMVLLGIINWTGIARLIRGQILSERQKDYILAAKALGIKDGSILIKHILPNILSIVIVQATLGFAINLLVEAGLSFLGFGVQEPYPSWGNMMTAAQTSDVIQIFWWRWIIPALAVFTTAFSVNLIGDALRDALDPRANER